MPIPLLCPSLSNAKIFCLTGHIDHLGIHGFLNGFDSYKLNDRNTTLFHGFQVEMPAHGKAFGCFNP